MKTARLFVRVFPLLAYVVLLSHLLSGCKPSSLLEEEYDIAVLGYVLVFEVPDSSSSNNIRVLLQGTIGESTAYRFDRINIARTDSVFRIGVWGRESFKTGATYDPRENTFDTTLVLTSPRRGMHYFDVVAAQGVLRDSTFVY